VRKRGEAGRSAARSNAISSAWVLSGIDRSSGGGKEKGKKAITRERTSAAACLYSLFFLAARMRSKRGGGKSREKKEKEGRRASYGSTPLFCSSCLRKQPRRGGEALREEKEGGEKKGKAPAVVGVSSISSLSLSPPDDPLLTASQREGKKN